jgi:hypothetical protein
MRSGRLTIKIKGKVECMGDIIKKQGIPLWFQIVLAFGVAAISTASAAYSWQTWRIYDFERKADGICEFVVNDHLGPDYPKEREDVKTGEDVRKYIDAWMARRQCINQLMGRDSPEPSN